MKRLLAVIDRLRAQIDRVVVVDNRSLNREQIACLCAEHEIACHPLEANMGVAYAQNLGIAQALEEGFSYVMLMDQDTLFPIGGIAPLYLEYERLREEGFCVGAIGNSYRDLHSGNISDAWVTRNRRLRRVKVGKTKQKSIEVDFVISSGSLYHRSVFNSVGLMDESLFIDLVDVEWGLRAVSNGFKNFLNTSVVVEHVLGDRVKRILGRLITLRSPVRDYYVIRNSLILLRRRSVPWAWRRYLFLRVFLYLFIFGIFADDAARRRRYMWRALWAGLRFPTGPSAHALGSEEGLSRNPYMAQTVIASNQA